MRARNIKPGFFKSEGIAACSFQARILFVGLWCMADREGRLEDRPARIKAEIFPYDNVNVEKLLEEIADKKDCDGSPSFIVRYGRTKKYIQILNFLTHQHPHINEKESEIPDISTCTIQVPELSGASTVQVPEDSGVLPSESLLLNPDIRNPEIYNSVISYLNEKAKTRYKIIETNKKLIRARLKDGYSLDDFKMVIDKKVAEWIGTDQAKYLRPETLFGNKFDGYLNQPSGGMTNGHDGTAIRHAGGGGAGSEENSAGKIPSGFWA